MISLTQKIIAYLSINNIDYTLSDFSTGYIDGLPDSIIFWNTEKIGDEPTEAQMNAAYPIWEGQQIAAQNSAEASTLLQKTDWTATVDISDPKYSNPYLVNQDDFLAYRSQVRQIAVNPPTTPAVFPDLPAEQWSAA